MNNKMEIIERMKEDLRMCGYSLEDYAAAWKMLFESGKVSGSNGEKFRVIKVETENNNKMFPLLLESSQSTFVGKGRDLYEFYNELSRFGANVEDLLSNENNYLFAYGESLIVQVTIRFMSFDDETEQPDGFVFDDDAAKSGNRIGDFTALAWDYNTYRHMFSGQYVFCDDSRHSVARQSGIEVLADVFDGHSVIGSILQTNRETLYGYKPHNPRNPWDVLIEKLDEYNEKLIEQHKKNEEQQ